MTVLSAAQELFNQPVHGVPGEPAPSQECEEAPTLDRSRQPSQLRQSASGDRLRLWRLRAIGAKCLHQGGINHAALYPEERQVSAQPERPAPAGGAGGLVVPGAPPLIQPAH